VHVPSVYILRTLLTLYTDLILLLTHRDERIAYMK